MPDEERVAVQTYVTETQRDSWRREAENKDMSQAEYVRTMVQAGRRGFNIGDSDAATGSETRKRQDPAPTPGVDDMKDRVLAVLQETEFAGWDVLLAGITDDIEERLEETLEELQSDDRIRYSGRHGGYTVIDNER
jgi:hypothetical protein